MTDQVLARERNLYLLLAGAPAALWLASFIITYSSSASNPSLAGAPVLARYVIALLVCVLTFRLTRMLNFPWWRTLLYSALALITLTLMELSIPCLFIVIPAMLIELAAYRRSLQTSLESGHQELD